MTAHEVFRVVCGQGGCSPEYFMDRMGISEAREYMEGVHLRRREGWEQTRVLCGVLIKVMTGEDSEIRLPWDDEMEDVDMDNENDLEELRLKAERMEEFFNGKGRKMESKV